jgi:predicted outer membrane repeat protein
MHCVSSVCSYVLHLHALCFGASFDYAAVSMSSYRFPYSPTHSHTNTHTNPIYIYFYQIQLGGTTEIQNGATGLAYFTVFDLNQAKAGGGAIRVLGGGSTLVLKDSGIFDQSTNLSGGALHVQNGDATLGVNPIHVFIYNCILDRNVSRNKSGGAIWSNRNAVFHISKTHLGGNRAETMGEKGGAIFLGGDSRLDSSENTFNINFVQDAATGGSHMFINDGFNNYMGCDSDTFSNPGSGMMNGDNGGGVMTSSEAFSCTTVLY